MKKKFQISRMYAALIKSAALAIMFCVIAFLIWSTLDNWTLACITTASLIFSLLFAGYIDSMVKPIKVDIKHGSHEQTVDEKAEVDAQSMYDFFMEYAKTTAIAVSIENMAAFKFKDWDELSEEQKVMRAEYEDLSKRAICMLADRNNGEFEHLPESQTRLLYVQLSLMVYYMLALAARCELCGMKIQEENNTNNEEGNDHVADNQNQEN